MPGSAEPLAGEYSGPGGAFATGQALDLAPGGPVLLGQVDWAAGDDDRFDGVSDDELLGIICAADRCEAAASALKHTAVAELIRRRPASGCTPQGPAGMPEAWDEFTRAELAPALGESRYAVDGLLDLAHDLTVKLPGTMALFRVGVISRYKAQVISHATQLLDPAEARAAEAMVLDRAGRLTPGALRAAIARAVMEVAPDKARKRREKAAKSADVQQWAEFSGNAALAGRELPPADVLAAGQRIRSWADQLKAAGLEGSTGELRARAFLDLLLGRDSRPDKAAAGGIGPAAFAATINLTTPLATLLDLADRPGEIPGIGPIDPWLARDLARYGRQPPEDKVVRDGHRQARARHRARMRPPRAPRPQERTRASERPGAAGVHVHPRGSAWAARRVRHLAAAHPGRRAGAADRPRPAQHPGMRPPVPGPRPRSRGQAETPVPGPARHVHRALLPQAVSPLGLRAQRPLRGGRKDVPVQRRPEMPLRPPAQATPEMEGRPAPRRHVPVDHPVRASVHHRAHAVPHMNGTGNGTGRRRAARSDQAANRAASRAAAARTTR